MPLPVFVINLDRRPDRWQAISARLDELRIKFEHIQAVDANDLPALTETDAVDPGAKACLLSHCKAMRAFLDTGSDAALIFEDDAVIASDTAALLDSTDWWPQGTGAIKLETTGTKPRILGATMGQTPSGRTLRRMYRGNAGAAGYLIGRGAVETVLAACAPAPMAIDLLLFGLHRSSVARHLRPLQIFPAMVRQRRGPDDPSDVAQWYMGVHLPGRRRAGRFASLRHSAAVYALLACRGLDRIPVPYRDKPVKAAKATRFLAHC